MMQRQNDYRRSFMKNRDSREARVGQDFSAQKQDYTQSHYTTWRRESQDVFLKEASFVVELMLSKRH